jgi:hypothetical protein
MDIARILGSPIANLEKYPFGSDFLKVKKGIVNINEIHFYDRSKLYEASFGLKELRELTQIPNSRVSFSKEDYNEAPIPEELMANVFPQYRGYLREK